MGNEPPIPTDPIQQIPQAVLRQTPMPAISNLPEQQQPQHQTPRPGNMGMTPPPQQQPYQQPSQQSFQALGGGQNQGQAQQERPSRIMPGIGQPVQDNDDGGAPSRVMPSMGTNTQAPAPSTFLAQAIPVVLQPVGAPVAMQQAPPFQQQQQQLNGLTPGPAPPTMLGNMTAIDGTGPIIPSGPPPHPAHEADSYLDRADHEPRIRHMLQGAQSKTIHTSQYQGSEHPMTAQSFNKPLPTPGQQAGLQRANTAAPGGHGGGQGRASRAGTMMSTANNNNAPRNRRNSLMSNLHAHAHAHSNLNGGDRYPAFPHQQQNIKGHSRQSSWNGVDPANAELPK